VFNRPLTVLPCVIVLGVAFENVLSECELITRVIELLDNVATMLPDLKYPILFHLIFNLYITLSICLLDNFSDGFG
jgi:hypothetical protein